MSTVATPPIDAVLDYLRAVATLRGDRDGFTFGSVEAYLLAHGRAWAPGPITHHTASGTTGQCYDISGGRATY